MRDLAEGYGSAPSSARSKAAIVLRRHRTTTIDPTTVTSNAAITAPQTKAPMRYPADSMDLPLACSPANG